MQLASALLAYQRCSSSCLAGCVLLDYGMVYNRDDDRQQLKLARTVFRI